MGGFVVDISHVPPDIRNFPNGICEATITEATLDVARRSGDPLIRIDWEAYHPSVGTVTFKDSLPLKFPAKVKAFWMALNDFSEQEALENPQVDLSDPSGLVGAQMLLHIGVQENSQTGKSYKTVVSPWYYPLSRTDLIPEGTELPV